MHQRIRRIRDHADVDLAVLERGDRGRGAADRGDADGVGREAVALEDVGQQHLRR